jgi:HlyD family secretion protein
LSEPIGFANQNVARAANVIDARIAPQDIDRLRPGQIAFIRFPAFNQRTTPEVSGQVLRIAPDLTHDPATNTAYYVARITLSAAEKKRLGKVRLVPGMPAEVHVRTEERTALSYFIKPLQDQIARAFKER